LHLYYPATLKGDNNPNTQGDADPLLNYPYGCCGKEVPGNCKGHLGLVGTDEGKATANWVAGQKANFSVSGHAIDTPIFNPVGGNHGGGSAQIGFSIDGGKTFKVAKTWQGNWPDHNVHSLEPADMTYDFEVPADLPEGDAIFAWTWVNREVEFNMNCAVVSIQGSSGDPDPSSSAAPEPTSTQASAPDQTSEPSQFTLQGCTCACPAQTWSQSCTCTDCQSPSTKQAVAFTSRPDMLLNIDFEGASCKSEGNPTEMKYPDPGPDVVVADDGQYALAEP
ncbi:hypothetical protein K491DRAFT_554458, partial [Lophiostoma macrostomum CBS 122681]